MQQPSLFIEHPKATQSIAERIVLCALGEFQSRGKELIGRELPLDRLRGALRRAARAFDVDELTDEQAAETLAALGAIVRQLPAFVAKHPYRIIVQSTLALSATVAYQEMPSEPIE